MTALQEMRKNNNVSEMRNKTFVSAFNGYMNELRENSYKTYQTYYGHFKEFFEIVLGKNKDITDITWDDILKISYDDVKDYREYLISYKENKNSKATANQKVCELRALWKELKRSNSYIDCSVVNLKRLRVKEVAKGRDAFTEDEMEKLIEFASKRKFKGKIQKMFFTIAYVTGLRKSALLGLEWDMLKKEKDISSGEEYWCFEVYDKNGSRLIPIRNDIYEELCEIEYMDCRKMKGNNDRVFRISSEKLQETINDFCNEYGIEGRFAFHSLRKASSDSAHNLTGDLKAVQNQIGDKSEGMVLGRYRGTRYKIGDFPGLSMLNGNESGEIRKVIEGLSKEELVDVIMGCSKIVQREIVKGVNG